jgi:apolipoprotein N-acyltransferase
MKCFQVCKTSPWLLPALSGVLIGTSYIPFPPWASLFCFVPLWMFWYRQTSLKAVFLGGVLTAFVFTLIGFNWVTYLLHEFAHLPWPLAVIGMAAFALLAHLFVPMAGVLWFWGQRLFQWPEHLSLGLMALITTLCEAYSLTLFDWNFGYSWYGAALPVYHWAEVIGFSGLSAATLLCNLPLYFAWKNRSNNSGKVVLTTVLSGFLLLNLGGVWLENRLPAPDASLKALLVQGNIGNSEKLAAELGRAYEQEIFRKYLELTDKAVSASPAKIDFVMWPETAFPALLGEKYKLQAYPAVLSDYLKENRLALITGAYSVDPSSHRLTNSMFVLDANGDIVPPHYSKTILLAFGEYIPGEQIFPQIRNWLPPTGQFARGAGPTALLRLNDYKMGAQICYESLFPAFTRSLADLGAQFIVNATNDSWYGQWQEPYQHMVMTLARGVEFRRPVLRVTNTGISTVSLATGEILERSPIHESWAGVYDVPYLRNPPATFYQEWFWLVPSLLWGSLAVLLGTGWRISHARGLK